jgi:hypothetical protein
VDEFGETPESLRDLSVSLNKVGDVWAAQRSGRMRWRVIRRACRSVAKSWMSLAKRPKACATSRLAREDGIRRALWMSLAGMAGCVGVLSIKTPESLDLLVSHAKMALALSGMGNRPLACEHALALQLATVLLENHPDDPQTQEDYRNAQILASEVCGSTPFGVR